MSGGPRTGVLGPTGVTFLGAGLDGLADAVVGAARHMLRISSMSASSMLAALGPALPDLRHRGHDLAGLAVAALRDVLVDPRLLHRVQVVADGVGQALDRGDLVVRLISETGTEQGLNALPLMWLVQALQTLMPQPYLGPVTPRRSRITQSRRTSSSMSTVTYSPLSLKVC